MQDFEKKASLVLVDKIKQQILDGTLKSGDKLPAERELAASLSISRNSVREGLRVLENIGVLTSEQGSGNYISQDFQKPMADILSLMYSLGGLDQEAVLEFRYMIEREAVEVCCKRIDQIKKDELKNLSCELLFADNEARRAEIDRKIHLLIVENSGNPFLFSNYQALLSMIERTLPQDRASIISGMATSRNLDRAHEQMVKGVIENNPNLALQGLERHFDYMRQYGISRT